MATNAESKTMGGRIREERTRLQLNQAEFGEVGGVSKASQINYEADNRVPDLLYFSRAVARGVDASYVLTGVRQSLQVAALMNWPLHDQLLQLILQWEEIRGPLAHGKRMELLRLFYTQFSVTGIVDTSTVEIMLKLADQT
jgi:transcriptional regulator with XRE-family HTH domain